MKLSKNTSWLVLWCCCFFYKTNAQCSIFFSPSVGYNCSTGLAFISYTINGAIAPYNLTAVNTANNATVTTGFTSTGSGTLTSLPQGLYNIFISASNNCTAQVNYQVNISPSATDISFQNTSSVTCNGGNDGMATAIPPTSFSANPTYFWTPGAYNTAQVSNLSAGIVYTVTISDAAGCVRSKTISVIEPPAMVSTLASTFIPCFGQIFNTTILSTGNVGLTNYTINGVPQTGNNAVITGPGIQTIITKDSKGCMSTTTVLVTQEIQTLISFNVTKPTCRGSADGSIISGVTNAPGPFSYNWLPGATVNPNLSNVPIGTYTLSVLDGNACTTSSVIVVLPAVSATVTAVTKSENCSAADGSFTLSVAGVNPPFTYTTIPVGPHNTPTLGGLSSGSYTTITNYNNICFDTITINIGNLSTVSITIQNLLPVLCYNNCTASLSIGLQNAVFPVTYSATGQASTTTNVFTNLCAGFYVINVMDANGCPASTTLNLAPPSVFSYSANGPSTACAGKQISLQGAASGGSGGYIYVWNPGSVVGQFVNLTPAGTTIYSLNVYDSNGCTQAPAEVTVNVRPLITVSVNASNTGICPGSTAQITPTVTGGDGNYTYLWLPGNTTGSTIYVANLTVPTYSLVVNDGCGSPTVIKLVNVNLFPVIKPSFQVTGKRGCEPFCTDFVNTTARSTGATWNYGDNPIEQIGESTSHCYLRAGIFDLQMSVIDSNACKTTFVYPAAIEVLASPKADFTSVPAKITILTGENVLLKNLTKDAVSYKWIAFDKNYGETENIHFAFRDTGCYRFRLVAENLNRCIDTADKYLCVVEDFNFYMPNSFTPNDNNLNDFLIPKGTGWLTTNYLFEVYNRWGTVIFQTNDVNKGWDGSNSGALTPFSIFAWRIKVMDTEEIGHEFIGHVTVFR